MTMRFVAFISGQARNLRRAASEFPNKDLTFKEIISREESNEGSIWLYREGMFMKAYERRMHFAHTLIHEFN